MGNLLSLITFIPCWGRPILALFLRGNDEAAAQKNAKWVRMTATVATFVCRCSSCSGSIRPDTGFQFVEERQWLLGHEL